MLISPELRALNAELHERIPAYGTGGFKWAPAVAILARSVGASSILDYGCGKGSLREVMPSWDVREYDPAIAGKVSMPEPADLVCCLDVLEHVDLESLDAVLSHLRSLSLRALLVDVACKPSGKLLADGRPAHINVQTPEWWNDRLSRIGRIDRLPSPPDEFAAVITCA